MTEALDTTSKELYSQFEWYTQTFDRNVQASSDDFLLPGIQYKLLSVSKSLNSMSQDESYFVTKIKINPLNEIYIRNSDKAINTILTRALGPVKNFDINKLTELEAKMITAFNDNLYNFISGAFVPTTQQNKNFDLTNLTFFIYDNENNLGGKIIISFPTQIVTPQVVTSIEEKFSYEYFSTSLVDIDIKIGSTTFTVGDLKALEAEDIIVLENSNIQFMRAFYQGCEKDFRIAPNPALIISVDNDGGEEMASNIPSNNLWDSIQVEMGAEFDKVKISLGELKNIEQGLVVDISSIYNNNVTLKVENKIIASGELVIVNDRYGIKVNKIYAEQKPDAAMPMSQEQHQNEDYAPEQEYQEQYVEEPINNVEEPVGETVNTEDEGDFDYSDFDLEDEDL